MAVYYRRKIEGSIRTVSEGSSTKGVGWRLEYAGAEMWCRLLSNRLSERSVPIIIILNSDHAVFDACLHNAQLSRPSVNVVRRLIWRCLMFFFSDMKALSIRINLTVFEIGNAPK